MMIKFIFLLCLILGLSPFAAVADDSLYDQDEHCFEKAQSIYDDCTKKAKLSGGLNDENHHSCLSRYHEKIDSCLLPE
jgi:hypothetical protein